MLERISVDSKICHAIFSLLFPPLLDGTILFINNEAKSALNGMPLNILAEPKHDWKQRFLDTAKGVWRIRTVPIPNRKEKMILLEPLSSNGHRIPDICHLALTSTTGRNY